MNKESRTMNSVRNIMTGFIGQALQVILGFINRTVFIRILSMEYLGISGLFSNILSVLSLAELGIGAAFTYALYKPLADKDEDEISSLMAFYRKAYRIIGTIIMIIGIFIIPFLKYIIRSKPQINENINIIYLFYLFNTAITYFFSYRTSIICADQQSYLNAIVSYSISIIQIIVQILILVITKNFLLYLSVQSISILLYSLIIYKLSDKLYPFLSKKNVSNLKHDTKAELIKNIKALMIIKLSGVLVNSTDNIIITFFSGLASVGLCSNYYLLINIINGIINQIHSGLTASIGNLNAKKEVEKKYYIFNVLCFFNCWIYGFSSIGICVLINDIIKVWLGANYVLSFPITIILAINFYMVGILNSVWTYKNTMGLFNYGKYILLFTASINIVLSFILGNFMGLFGILLATAISRLLTNFWYDPLMLYEYGFKKNVRKYYLKIVKYTLFTILNLIITYYICNIILVDQFVFLILKFFVCIVVSNTLYVIKYRKNDEFIYLFGRFVFLLKNFSNKICCHIDK